MKKFRLHKAKVFAAFLSMLLPMVIATGCIDDDFSSNPGDQPVFSVDSLKMGEIYTEEESPTFRFTVHNCSSKGLNVSKIYLADQKGGEFFVNVDGISGESFENVEIRAHDSIYVLVKAKPAANGNIVPVETSGKLRFLTNGRESELTIHALGVDVERLRAEEISGVRELSAGKPYIIYDSLKVLPNASLIVQPGTRMFFHNDSRLIVEGNLTVNGTASLPVVMCGDRTGNVVTDISFDIMSRQWDGVEFRASSTDNRLSHCIIKNTWFGIFCDNNPDMTAPKLRLLNCRLHNSGSRVLTAYNSRIEAYGTEFSEGAEGLVYLEGGNIDMANCTFANNYLFAHISGPDLALANVDDTDKTGDSPFMNAQFTNCIFYGIGNNLSRGDYTNTKVWFTNCLFKSKGEDDDNFISCLWDKDPLYYTVRADYLFDYRLKEESPAIGAGLPGKLPPDAANDFYGLPRGISPDLGAYVFTPPQKMRR